MEPVWIPLVSGLLGALVGSASSLAAIFMQTRAQQRRERLRLVIEAAMQEHRSVLELMKLPGGPTSIQPLPSYIYYHLRFMNLIEESHLSPDSMKELDKEMAEVYQVCKEPTRKDSNS